MFTIKIKTFKEDYYILTSDYIGVGNLFLSNLGSDNQRVKVYERLIGVDERLVLSSNRTSPTGKWLTERVINVF
jgi:hypothetical protein